MATATRARKLPVNTRFKKYHPTLAFHALAICGAEYGAATGRDDSGFIGRQIRKNDFFTTTESRFTFLLENEIDLHAGAFADRLIGITKGQRQRARQPKSDRTLAGAHRAYEKNLLHGEIAMKPVGILDGLFVVMHGAGKDMARLYAMEEVRAKKSAARGPRFITNALHQ